MVIRRLIWVLAASLLASACLPVTSQTPVGSTGQLGADANLAGTWKGTVADDKNVSWFHFLPQTDNTMDVVIVTAPPGDTDGGWAQFKIQTAQLGDNHYIDAVEILDSGKPATDRLATEHIPLLYRYRDAGTVVLYLIDEQQAANAVRAGKISGTVESGEYGDVRITADAAELDAFFQSKDSLALFTAPWAVLTKVD